MSSMKNVSRACRLGPRQAVQDTLDRLSASFAADQYLLSFQSDGKLSNETYATYMGSISPTMGEMSICYWFYIHYHHTTMSLASYCAPANYCTPVNTTPKCSNIRKTT